MRKDNYKDYPNIPKADRKAMLFYYDNMCQGIITVDGKDYYVNGCTDVCGKDRGVEDCVDTITAEERDKLIKETGLCRPHGNCYEIVYLVYELTQEGVELLKTNDYVEALGEPVGHIFEYDIDVREEHNWVDWETFKLSGE